MESAIVIEQTPHRSTFPEETSPPPPGVFSSPLLSSNVTKLPSPKVVSKIAVASRSASPGNVLPDSGGSTPKRRSSVTSRNTTQPTELSAGGQRQSSSTLLQGAKPARTSRTTPPPIPLSATIKRQSSTNLLPDDSIGPRGVRATRSSSLRSLTSSDKKVQRDSVSSRDSVRRSVTASPLPRAAETTTSARSSTTILTTSKKAPKSETTDQPRPSRKAPAVLLPPSLKPVRSRSTSLSSKISPLTPLTPPPPYQTNKDGTPTKDGTPPTPTNVRRTSVAGRRSSIPKLSSSQPVLNVAKALPTNAKVLVQPEQDRPSTPTIVKIPPSDDGHSDVEAVTQQRPKDPPKHASPVTRRGHSKSFSQSHDTLTSHSPTRRPISDFANHLTKTFRQSDHIIQNNEYEMLMMEYDELRRAHLRQGEEYRMLVKWVKQHGDGGFYTPVGHFNAGSIGDIAAASNQGVEPEALDLALQTLQKTRSQLKASRHDLPDSTRHILDLERSLAELSQIAEDKDLQLSQNRAEMKHMQESIDSLGLALKARETSLKLAQSASLNTDVIDKLETALAEREKQVAEFQRELVTAQERQTAEHKQSSAEFERVIAGLREQLSINEEKLEKAVWAEAAGAEAQTRIVELEAARRGQSAELNELELQAELAQGQYEEMLVEMDSKIQDQSSKLADYEASILTMQAARAEHSALVTEVNELKAQAALRTAEYEDMMLNVRRCFSKIQNQNQKLAEYEAKISEMQLALAEKEALVVEMNDLKLQVKLQKDKYEELLSDKNSKIADQNQNVTKYEASISEMQPAIEEKHALVAEVDKLELSLDIAVEEQQALQSKLDDQTQRLAEYESSIPEMQLALAEKDAIVAELNDLRLQVKLQKDKYEEMLSDMNSRIADQNQKVAKYEASISEMQPVIEEKSALVAEVDTLELSLDIAVEEQREMRSKIDDQNRKLAEYETSISDMQRTLGQFGQLEQLVDEFRQKEQHLLAKLRVFEDESQDATTRMSENEAMYLIIIEEQGKQMAECKSAAAQHEQDVHMLQQKEQDLLGKLRALEKESHNAATLHVPIADDDQLQQVGWWNIYSNAPGQIHPFL